MVDYMQLVSLGFFGLLWFVFIECLLVFILGQFVIRFIHKGSSFYLSDHSSAWDRTSL